MTLEAPATYGMYRFAKWTNEFGQTISTDQVLPVSLSNDTTVRAEYALNPNSAEILVKQGDTPVLPGAVYDFGTHRARAAVTIPFTIENPGAWPFIVHSVDVSSAQFSVLSQIFPVTIAPHSALTFEIAYTPSEPGAHAVATVTIPNNAPYLQPYAFALTGEAELVKLRIAKAGTGQGTVLMGEQKCEAGCSELVVPLMPATALVLKAIPETGSAFVGFQDVSGNPVSDIVYTIQDLVLRAVFNSL